MQRSGETSKLLPDSTFSAGLHLQYNFDDRGEGEAYRGEIWLGNVL